MIAVTLGHSDSGRLCAGAGQVPVLHQKLAAAAVSWSEPGQGHGHPPETQAIICKLGGLK